MRKENLDLFKSIFKGREDIFALHWKKGSKSGYMPAYIFDPYIYRLHSMAGGNLANFTNKKLRPLTEEEIIKHLKGEQRIGIYPLLIDNTSRLIAADFDGQNWEKDSRRFIRICQDYAIPAYLERSQSGNVGHVWIFFEHPYPAWKSRKIIRELLLREGLLSALEGAASFDRLFPNQNKHSGKGFGNLIALPLHGKAMKKGNSCFIDEYSRPYSDQWAFLAAIREVSSVKLNGVYEILFGKENPGDGPSGKLLITLREKLYLNRFAIPPELGAFLRKELTFDNPEYFIRKKMKKNTYDVERTFRYYEETDREVIVPRGFTGKLIRFCRKYEISYEFSDQRKRAVPINLENKIELRSYQKSVLEVADQKDFGIIVAPPGSGKTIMALKIIAKKQQPALIVLHRIFLMEQWKDRISEFLGILKSQIGTIGKGGSTKSKDNNSRKIIVATIQSLTKYAIDPEKKNVLDSFGTLIVDECHHIPAKSYRNVISKIPSYYQYGLTATPFRKGDNGKSISIHLGEVIASIHPAEMEGYKRARLVVRDTSLDVPFNPKTDTFEVLSKILIHDSSRNKQILADLRAELGMGRKIVVITERKEHIDALYQFLKGGFETVTLSGEDSPASRRKKWEVLHRGDYQVLITTGQYFGEGTDLQNANCLFLVYPFTFKGKLIQYIGRVQRSEITPLVYDYRDRNIPYLDRMFLQRNKHYRNLDRQATLFDEQGVSEVSWEGIYTLDRMIKKPFQELDFRYGAFAFYYKVDEAGVELEFEIENEVIRPELEVLKPYFSKILKLKEIRIDIFAEFDNGLLVSQSAESAELDQVTREIIEGMWFRFVHDKMSGNKKSFETEEDLLGIYENQMVGEDSSEYGPENQLLEDLLQDKNVKHYPSLRYLATQHDPALGKLRFVLDPFSFVLLLRGKEQIHVVLETLDTEEATYMWHVEIEEMSKINIRRIEETLALIKEKGRQKYLETRPENFSRIRHDYVNERKGFVLWRDQLEARLF